MAPTATLTAAPATARTTIDTLPPCEPVDTLCGHVATDLDAQHTDCGDWTCPDGACLTAHAQDCGPCAAMLRD